MKIIRDGKEYELTTQELFEAWEEHEHKCNIEDVDALISGWCEEWNIPRASISKSIEEDILEEYEDELERYEVEDFISERKEGILWECAHHFLPTDED